MSTTAAQRFLQQQGVPFESREYDHKVKGAEFAAEALGWPLQAMAKTLVVGLGDDKRFCLCVLPGTVELSTRALARAAGVKAARLATEEEAERLTGYRVGGISPCGTRRPLPVWLEASLMGFPRIGVNGGRRGLIVFLAPPDLERALGARVADLAA